MRLLLYTASGFFIVLAGVFSYFAFQGTEHSGGGAKVVLSIDSRAAPGDAAPTAENPDRDVYAEAAMRLKSLEAAKEQGDGSGGPRADAPGADVNGDPVAETSGQQDVAAGDRDQANDAPQAAGPDAKADSDALSALPGTALAGADDTKPPFRTVDQSTETGDGALGTAAPYTSLGNDPGLAPVARDEQASTSGNGRDAPETADALAPAGRDTAGLRRRQDASPENAPDAQGLQKRDAGNLLAALNERDSRADAPSAAPPANGANTTAATAPALAGSPLPPPLPLRRTETKTAAVSGWGNTKVTKADKAALKPARVAILLRGLGRDDRNSSDAVTKLPPAISLAVMPFPGGAQSWAKKASEQGHELLVQLPLEPTDYPNSNPGPETLLSSASADQNASRLNTVLGRFEGYSGVTNFLGGKMLQSKAALRPILEDVKSRGLIYIGEGNNNSHALVRGLAGEVGLRYGGANVVIDAQPAPAAIQAALEKLVAIARKDGSAIGLGYASHATIEQLEAWSRALTEQGVTLVPVGTLAQTPGAS